MFDVAQTDVGVETNIDYARGGSPLAAFIF